MYVTLLFATRETLELYVITPELDVVMEMVGRVEIVKNAGRGRQNMLHTPYVVESTEERYYLI